MPKFEASLTENFRGVNYNHNMGIIQATGITSIFFFQSLDLGLGADIWGSMIGSNCSSANRVQGTML